MYLSDLTEELLDEAGCMRLVAPLPEDFDDRVRYLGDVLAQMCMNQKVKDDRLCMFLRSMASALSYLLNSSSYRDGELHDYDAAALAGKLRCVSGGR
jgi:hypothetical protein